MAFDLARVWRIAQAVIGVAEASRSTLGPTSPRPEAPDVPAAGVFGALETRLTGVLVSALKEAFDRDAARLDVERAALEDQRRRAEEALRLELVRQASDRALQRLRAIGAIALVVWIVSVGAAMAAHGGLGTAGRVLLGVGWASLVATLAACLAAHSEVTRWVAGPRTARDAEVPNEGAWRAAPWLLLLGLVLVGSSLLVTL
jgi:hypothetical protein